MPPKRKRASVETVDEATPARTTRSASAAQKNENGSSTTAGKRRKSDIRQENEEARSKPVKSTAKKSFTKNAKSKKASEVSEIDEEVAVSSSSVPKRPNGRATTKNKTKVTKASKSTATTTSEPIEDATATQPALSKPLKLFVKYADEDNPDVIGADGLERLCTDLEVGMDTAGPLLLAWQVDSHEMGKITKTEWETTMESLFISELPTLKTYLHELDQLLFPTASGRKKQSRLPKSMNATRFAMYTANPREAFGKFYGFCFNFAKPQQARNIDMETATALWSVILAPKYPLAGEINEFVAERGTYKGATKDVWNMTLEFCENVQPDLSGYEEDGAWPTLLDDFVQWKKVKLEGAEGAAEI